MARPKYHFENEYWDFPVNEGAYVLYQTGDLSCQSNYVVEEHVQLVHEISYVVSGCGKMWIDGEEIALYPRMVVVNRIGERHRIATGPKEKLRIFYLGFAFSRPVQDRAVAILNDFFEHPGRRVIYNAVNIQECFVDLFDEILRKDELSSVIIESSMHRILCGVYRAHRSTRALSYRLNNTGTLDSALVYEVVHYIDSHAEDGALLSGLSSRFGYSYEYLARKFAAVTGESLRDYHSRRRFELACKFLKSGASVTAVAERMGYASIHSFSNAFKKRFGVSPKQYSCRQEQANGRTEDEYAEPSLDD